MPGKKPSAAELESFRQLLTSMVGVLSGDIGKLEEEALGTAEGSKDGLKDGDADGYNVEFSLQLLERDESTMRELLDAVERVDNGTFGRCEECKGWIRKERLKTVPHARLCIECQRREEEEVA
jgi:RNA polymerase-binding transcription factor DksA